MNILLTGGSGFIGYHLSKKLVSEAKKITILDNLNDYYDINLKLSRLKDIGFSQNTFEDNIQYQSELYDNLFFYKSDISSLDDLSNIFNNNSFDSICNLAAQAGVRYSIENPFAYQKSNVEGFLNLLEMARKNNIFNFSYASSSSVYGKNTNYPFSENDSVDHPVSIYAATKKSNELFAHAYSEIYGIRTTGMRFFTVYGPFGRPDMAYFSFTKDIYNGKPIKVFNKGDMYRDFTYVDDIVDGIISVIKNPSEADRDWDKEKKLSSSNVPYRIVNLGNNEPVKLSEFIAIIEELTNKEFSKDYQPIQKGDVLKTFADIDYAKQNLEFDPKTTIKDGLNQFVSWYKTFYDC
jgi:UDP-glucuronate 4-epimerase